MFFNKISTPEEMERMKSLHDAGNVDELRTIAKEIIARQSGDGKTIAAKMEIVSNTSCSNLCLIKNQNFLPRRFLAVHRRFH